MRIYFAKKLSILLLLPIMFLYSSCEKDQHEDTADFLTVNIDGTRQKFINVLGKWNGNSLEIRANKTINNENKEILISLISDAQKATAGNYSLNNNSPFVLFSNFTGGKIAYSLSPSTQDQFDLIITTLNSEKISGTFSGVLVASDSTATDKMILTEGVFNMPMKP
ncbi:hypothetical protein [Chryseobacterium sp.]|uniref:hypothetical protein n=1 Tax=Chryseobacterium sp. TaxID=1871047 RepID=UPI003890577D